MSDTRELPDEHIVQIGVACQDKRGRRTITTQRTLLWIDLNGVANYSSPLTPREWEVVHSTARESPMSALMIVLTNELIRLRARVAELENNK